MKSLQVIGATLLVGGLAWWWSASRPKLPTRPERPVRKNDYPSLAEQTPYLDPPASQTATMPSGVMGTACPNIATPEEYNAYAKVMGLPLFTDILPTNDPDAPARQTFNALVSGLKTMAGCYAPPDQDDTSTALPSDWADQSVSYK